MSDLHSQSSQNKKVVVLDEKDYPDEIKPPPNFFGWFVCLEVWDRLSET